MDRLTSQLTHRLTGQTTGCLLVDLLFIFPTVTTAVHTRQHCVMCTCCTACFPCRLFYSYSYTSLFVCLLLFLLLLLLLLLLLFSLELHRKRSPKTVTSSFQTAVSTLQHVFSLCAQCGSIKLNLIILEVFINFIRQYPTKIV